MSLSLYYPPPVVEPSHLARSAKFNCKSPQAGGGATGNKGVQNSPSQMKYLSIVRRQSSSSEGAPEIHKKLKKHKKHKYSEKKARKEKKSKKSKMGGKPSSTAEIGPNLAAASAASKGPMTKEQWEKQQSEVRRAFDPDTGRMRSVMPPQHSWFRDRQLLERDG